MSFFSTHVRLTPVSFQDAEAGLSRALAYLEEHLRFKLYDAESDRLAYATAKRKLETLTRPSEEELRNHYGWMRMEGDLDLGDSTHGVTGYVFPSGEGEASFALRLGGSVYESLYCSHPVYQGEINDEMARDLIGLSHTLGTLFGAAGFLYTTVPDVLTPVPIDELTALMTGHDENLIETNTIILAGVRESIVPLREVESVWRKENLAVSTSGFVVLNLFLPYPSSE